MFQMRGQYFNRIPIKENPGHFWKGPADKRQIGDVPTVKSDEEVYLATSRLPERTDHPSQPIDPMFIRNFRRMKVRTNNRIYRIRFRQNDILSERSKSLRNQ